MEGSARSATPFHFHVYLDKETVNLSRKKGFRDHIAQTIANSLNPGICRTLFCLPYSTRTVHRYRHRKRWTLCASLVAYGTRRPTDRRDTLWIEWWNYVESCYAMRCELLSCRALYLIIAFCFFFFFCAIFNNASVWLEFSVFFRCRFRFTAFRMASFNYYIPKTSFLIPVNLSPHI